MSSIGKRWTVPQRQLKQEKVDNIVRMLLEENKTVPEIAEHYGHCVGYIREIFRTRTVGIRRLRIEHERSSSSTR